MSDTQKKTAAHAAIPHVRDGMTIGIGTGSTAAYFIEALGEKVRAGLDIAGVPTSDATASRCRELGIPLIEPDETTRLDLAVDGADEIDPDGNLIKGGGGAMLREKIVARAAERFIVIADGSKKVPFLGAFPLPLEIVPFAMGLTITKVRAVVADLGGDPGRMALRRGDTAFARTDSGNLILDLSLGRLRGDVRDWERALEAVPGVVISGLFPRQAGILIIADDSTVEERPV